MQSSARSQGKKGKAFMKFLGIGFIVAFSFGLGIFASQYNLLPARAANSSNSKLPDDLNYDSVEEVYDELKRRYDGELDATKLLDGIKKGLADASGDNYTDYFNVDDTKAFYDSLNGSFDGIGAELDVKNEALTIVAPIHGSPAEKAGLRGGDIIAEIDGEETTGIRVEEAVVKIRGEKGTAVKLTIIRDGESKEYSIVRDTIVVPSVKHEMKADKIGYIQVTRFSEDTTKLAQESAADLKSKGAKAIILDVRNNSGGYVDAAVGVASLWQNNQVVFEQKTGGKVTRTERSKNSAVFDGVPTIVLMNENSASASEIVAGALHDNGHAKLIGTKSYGKGSVQQLEELTDGSTLKVTVARWFTPKGVNIDKDGIEPDIKVEMTDDDYTNDRDPQLDRALKELR